MAATVSCLGPKTYQIPGILHLDIEHSNKEFLAHSSSESGMNKMITWL